MATQTPIRIDAPERRRPRRSAPGFISSPGLRIGGGIALASGDSILGRRDNPYHWQTLVLLLPLFHNPTANGYRKPITPRVWKVTLREIQDNFSGVTAFPVGGWYWSDSPDNDGTDNLVRFEIDGIFTGHDIALLRKWKRTLKRRFHQNYIYMRLMQSGMSV